MTHVIAPLGRRLSLPVSTFAEEMTMTGGEQAFLGLVIVGVTAFAVMLAYVSATSSSRALDRE